MKRLIKTDLIKNEVSEMLNFKVSKCYLDLNFISKKEKILSFVNNPLEQLLLNFLLNK
jgi:hypothetical protein